MKEGRVRNFGIIAHIDAGKTTLTESILFNTGKERLMGNVDEGTTVTDWMIQEKERGISITSAVTTTYWKGFCLNIVDTPGHVDFTAEVERCLRVLDGAVVVFCGVNGVEAQSETVWRQASKYKVPRLVFINKCDRVGADFERVLNEIKSKFDIVVVPVTIPLFEKDKLIGVIDIIEEKEYLPLDFEKSPEYRIDEVRKEMKDYMEFWQHYLVDSLSSLTDDVNIFNKSSLKENVNLLRKLIRELTLGFLCVPLYTGSALKNIGVHNVLDGICYYLPAPEDIKYIEAKNPNNESEIIKITRSTNEKFVGLVFKTMATKYDDLAFLRVYAGKLSTGDVLFNWRTRKKERIQRIFTMHAIERTPIILAQSGDIVGVVGLKNTVTGDTLTHPDYPAVLESIEFPDPVVFSSIEPRYSDDKDKLIEVLNKLSKDDPTFKLKYDEENNQFLIYGMGELHLDIICDRIRREFNVEARIGKPFVSYKEAPIKTSSLQINYQKKIQEKMVSVKVGLTLTRNSIYKKNNIVFSENAKKISPEVKELIKKSISTALMTGGKYGYPVIESEFIVDSVESDYSELTNIIEEAVFFTATQVIKNNDFSILEPIMKLNITSSCEYVGSIIDDLNKRRAQITDIKNTGSISNIFAFVPVAEMIGYANTLRSISKGLASFTLEPHDYREIPEDIKKKLFEIY